MDFETAARPRRQDFLGQVLEKGPRQVNHREEANAGAANLTHVLRRRREAHGKLSLKRGAFELGVFIPKKKYEQFEKDLNYGRINHYLNHNKP